MNTDFKQTPQGQYQRRASLYAPDPLAQPLRHLRLHLILLHYHLLKMLLLLLRHLLHQQLQLIHRNLDLLIAPRDPRPLQILQLLRLRAIHQQIRVLRHPRLQILLLIILELELAIRALYHQIALDVLQELLLPDVPRVAAEGSDQHGGVDGEGEEDDEDGDEDGGDGALLGDDVGLVGHVVVADEEELEDGTVEGGVLVGEAREDGEGHDAEADEDGKEGQEEATDEDVGFLEDYSEVEATCEGEHVRQPEPAQQAAESIHNHVHGHVLGGPDTVESGEEEHDEHPDVEHIHPELEDKQQGQDEYTAHESWVVILEEIHLLMAEYLHHEVRLLLDCHQELDVPFDVVLREDERGHFDLDVGGVGDELFQLFDVLEIEGVSEPIVQSPRVLLVRSVRVYDQQTIVLGVELLLVHMVVRCCIIPREELPHIPQEPSKIIKSLELFEGVIEPLKPHPIVPEIGVFEEEVVEGSGELSAVGDCCCGEIGDLEGCAEYDEDGDDEFVREVTLLCPLFHGVVGGYEVEGLLVWVLA